MPTKEILRARLIDLLPAFAAAEADDICAPFQNAFHLNASDVLALYWPLPHELDPRPLARVLPCRFVLPVVVQRAAPLHFRLWESGTAMVPDLMHIPAPSIDAPVLEPTHILVPLLAFDRAGHRLGRGGGYYDRTLAAHPHAVRIGLAYAGQEQAGIPTEVHDMRLQHILTPAGVIHCSA